MFLLNMMMGMMGGKVPIALTPVAGYTSWFDVSQESYANNDPIDSLTDRGSAGNTVSNTLTTRPLFKTGIQNGKPGALFDGTNDALGTTGTTLGSSISVSAYTVFIVFNATAIDTANADTWDNDALVSDSSSNEYFSVNLKSTPAIFAYNWDTTDDNVSKSIAIGTPYIVQTRHESGNLYISLNGGSESSVASGNTGSITDYLWVGVGNSARYYNGYIHEILIYNTALSAPDIAANYTYLNSKWAVY